MIMILIIIGFRFVIGHRMLDNATVRRHKLCESQDTYTSVQWLGGWSLYHTALDVVIGCGNWMWSRGTGDREDLRRLGWINTRRTHSLITKTVHDFKVGTIQVENWQSSWRSSWQLQWTLLSNLNKLKPFTKNHKHFQFGEAHPIRKAGESRNSDESNFLNLLQSWIT